MLMCVGVVSQVSWDTTGGWMESDRRKIMNYGEQATGQSKHNQDRNHDDNMMTS